MKNKIEILKKFCLDRGHLREPFQINDQIIATDARILVSMDKNTENIQLKESDKLKSSILDFYKEFKEIEKSNLSEKINTDDIVFDICSECKGDLIIYECPECYGDGEVSLSYDATYTDDITTYHECPLCNGDTHISKHVFDKLSIEGSKETYKKNCPYCDCSGINFNSKNRITAGVRDLNSSFIKKINDNLDNVAFFIGHGTEKDHLFFEHDDGWGVVMPMAKKQ